MKRTIQERKNAGWERIGRERAEMEAELTRLRTLNGELLAALWQTATRYHEARKHEGVMDECGVLTCYEAAALLASQAATGQAKQGEERGG